MPVEHLQTASNFTGSCIYGAQQRGLSSCSALDSVPPTAHTQVVNKVRGKLSKLERKTLSALIVVDVHARDVATDLAAQGVSSETDFEWMSQLRSDSITQCALHHS